jgi:hypothetical protein
MLAAIELQTRGCISSPWRTRTCAFQAQLEKKSMMSRTFLPLALAGVAALSTVAFAAAQKMTGNVKSTDATRHELVLSTGPR